MNKSSFDIYILLWVVMGMAMFCIFMTMTSTSSMTVSMLMKTCSHDDVDQDPKPTGDQHNFGVNLKLLVNNSQDGHVDKDACDYPDHQDRHDGSHNLCSVPSKWHSLTTRFASHVDGKQGYHEGGKVSEKMCCISCNCQGVRQNSTNNLCRHEEDAKYWGKDKLVSCPEYS